MLPKKERLKRVDFNRSFSLGRRYHHRFFTVVYAPSPSFHASVVVSKKIAQKATARNTLRRRTYHALRDLARKTKVAGTYIVLLKKEVLHTTSTDVREALAGLLGTIGNTR